MLNGSKQSYQPRWTHAVFAIFLFCILMSVNTQIRICPGCVLPWVGPGVTVTTRVYVAPMHGFCLDFLVSGHIEIVRVVISCPCMRRNATFSAQFCDEKVRHKHGKILD